MGKAAAILKPSSLPTPLTSSCRPTISERDIMLMKIPSQPSKYTDALAHFNHLHTLKVFVHLREDASDFVAEYHQDVYGSKPMPNLKADLARIVSTRLFKSFFSRDRYARLRYLEVSFRHVMQEDRGQCYPVSCSSKVRRLVRDDAPSPLGGGFEVECDGKWRGS